MTLQGKGNAVYYISCTYIKLSVSQTNAAFDSVVNGDPSDHDPGLLDAAKVKLETFKQAYAESSLGVSQTGRATPVAMIVVVPLTTQMNAGTGTIDAVTAFAEVQRRDADSADIEQLESVSFEDVSAVVGLSNTAAVSSQAKVFIKEISVESVERGTAISELKVKQTTLINLPVLKDVILSKTVTALLAAGLQSTVTADETVTVQEHFQQFIEAIRENNAKVYEARLVKLLRNIVGPRIDFSLWLDKIKLGYFRDNVLGPGQARPNLVGFAAGWNELKNDVSARNIVEARSSVRVSHRSLCALSVLRASIRARLERAIRTMPRSWMWRRPSQRARRARDPTVRERRSASSSIQQLID